MTNVSFLLMPMVIYGVPVALGTFAILWLMGKHFGFDLLVYMLVPICSWLVLIKINDKGKTLSNFVAEPLILAIIVCVLITLHFVLERRGIFTGKPLEVLTAICCFLSTACVFFLMPALSE